MIAALALAALLGGRGGGQAPPPNVLVVVLDDVGLPERPLLLSINALAARGVEFTRAYATCSVCSPTRLALQTGMYSRRLSVGDLELNAHLMNNSQERIPLRVRFLPDLFDRTHDACGFGKWHLGRAPLKGEMNQSTSGPFCQGWDWRAGILTGIGSAGTPGAGGTSHYDWPRFEQGDLFMSTEYTTDAVVESFHDWLQEQDGPWLAWFAPFAPHRPFDPPPGRDNGTPRENFEHTLTYLDERLSAIFEAVPEDTVIIVTSDNGTNPDIPAPGYAVGSCKVTMQECGIRVPLVMAGPGILPQPPSHRLVSLVDVPATLAELLGSPIERGFVDSRSFANALDPTLLGTPGRPYVFAERYTPAVDLQALVEDVTSTRFLATGEVAPTQWKLRREDPDGAGPLPPVDLIFELLSDPMETSPRQDVPAGVRARLLDELAELPPRE